MMNAWMNLSPRDRRSLLIGGLGLLVLLPYWLVWMPLTERVTRLEQTLMQSRSDVAWMENAAEQIIAARGNALPAKRSGRSLLAQVDASVRAADLGSTARRVQPEGNERVRVWLEGVLFDPTVRLLADLQKRQGITVESLAVERRTEPGRVDVRLVVVEAAQ